MNIVINIDPYDPEPVCPKCRRKDPKSNPGSGVDHAFIPDVNLILLTCMCCNFRWLMAPYDDDWDTEGKD